MTVANAFRTALETNAMDMTTTWNGALANGNTHSANLNMFAQMGNWQTLDLDDFEDYFAAAWHEDKLVALRLLFFNRDVRGGQKVKKFLQHILGNYSNHNLEFRNWLSNNLHLIPEYGYWKDLYSLENTVLWHNAVELWANQIKEDYATINSPASNPISLAAKYAPTESQKATVQTILRKKEFLKHFSSPKQYRQILSALRTHLSIVEKIMSNNQWSEIEYSHVPSVAFLNYKKAFARHDAERFTAFVSDDTVKVNASVNTPVDVYRQYKGYSPKEDAAVEKVWKNLDNVFGSMREDVRILTVADCSGSMSAGVGSVPPIDVAHALTIYCAERNKGVFHNMYMTFSHTAKFYTLPGTSLYKNMLSLRKHSEVANTNLQAVFDEILRVATTNKVPQTDMPNVLLIISDMQFDSACGYRDKRNLDVIREKFEAAGYLMPTIVFWNVNSAKNFAATKHDINAILVSGYSEQMLKFVINAEPGKTPLDLMMDVVNSERYSPIIL